MDKVVKNIAVIYGSDSSEWEVSCKSGRFTASKIGRRFNVFEIFARFGEWSLVAYRIADNERVEIPENEIIRLDRNNFSVIIDGVEHRLQYAYIMQHGIPGENGQMQGYLEMMNIPFSSCSSFVSSITFDKYSCKAYLRDVDYVKFAKDVFIREGEVTEDFAQKVVEKLSLPLFIKPTDGGSSFGVTKVKSIEDFDQALKYAFSESKTLLAESAIVGRELTCAVYRDSLGESKALPVIEIITENEFFDYEAKYNGKSREICPAEISEELTKHIQEVSVKIYNHLGCKGVVRVDYILAEDGLYFLEINTIPGMTSASLVPQMVSAAGLDMTDFLDGIILS